MANRIRTYATAAALVAAAVSNASAGDLSLCLDTSTKVEAGGDVADKDLQAAQAACSRVDATKPAHEEQVKVTAAIASLNEERQRRHH